MWPFKKLTPQEEGLRGRQAGIAFCLSNCLVDIEEEIKLAEIHASTPMDCDTVDPAYDRGYLQGLTEGRARIVALTGEPAPVGFGPR